MKLYKIILIFSAIVGVLMVLATSALFLHESNNPGMVNFTPWFQICSIITSLIIILIILAYKDFKIK